MYIAYLIDRDSVGGGMEYIRRQMAAHPNDETRVFFSDCGDCTAAKMNAWGVEVVHVNHLKALLQLFRNPFVRPHGRVIFTVHGIHLRKYDFLPKSFFYRTKRLVRLSLERWLYRKCDTLIALTETDKGDIKRLYGANLSVVVEANSIDVSGLKAPVGLKYRENEFSYVCIARFDFQKGQDILVNAIDRAQKELRVTGKRTLLIGGGATLEETKRFVIEKGISDLVEFAGEIHGAGVYMTCAKVLIAPSRWEGMPYLLLEAVARGNRVIASDCPGNRDVLQDYSKAQIFPNEDYIALSSLLISKAF